ncbi:C-C motif chemokine 3 [Pteropus alecto]|uniref:C-C motif chemokine 3 n=1 Tax=Pteropus alecto TaxID=9402 RepID=UPI0003F1576F|nr:C-C motif chemokine 3 [Pteropus alecto]
MKVLGATVLVLLCTMALCSYDENKTNVASTCCFTYTSRPIPRGRVVTYFKTSGQCSKHGVIFLTKKGQHICADPHNAWVQEYISHLENPQLVRWSSVPEGSKEQK